MEGNKNSEESYEESLCPDYVAGEMSQMLARLQAIAEYVEDDYRHGDAHFTQKKREKKADEKRRTGK